MTTDKENKSRLLVTREGVSYVLPFIVVTCCFALWGFANDVTNPMVKAFSKIFRMSVTQGTLVQVAFYGGYFCMALPAALFIRRHSFKSGIVMGLALYAVGVLLFIPARAIGSFAPFLIAYFILTCGLSFLETTANPYILLMGDRETATRRLNLAQSFNPIGSLAGMFVAMNFIQARLSARLSPLDTAQRALLDDAEFETLKQSDLGVLVQPYALLAVVIVALLVVMLLVRVPVVRQQGRSRQILSRGCGGTVLLCGRPDHLLDVYYPIRHARVHGRGHARAGRRGALPALQHRGDGDLLPDALC